MVLLSIIIPVFNKEHYLSDCLDNIFEKQNVQLDSFEIVCIDDGSTDSSYNILQQYSKYNNLKIIRQENRGASVARNVGIRNSTGQYIWFVDADDYIFPNVLADLMSALKTGFDLYTIGVATDCTQQYNGFCNISDSADAIPSPYTFGNIVKRERIGNADIQFDEEITYGEDTLFWLQVGVFCQSIRRIDSYLYYYRKSNGSIMEKLKTSESARLKQFLDTIKGCHKLVLLIPKCKNVILKSRVIDACLTYNLCILNSNFIGLYKENVKLYYPLPFFCRIKYFFWYKELSISKKTQLVFLPRFYLQKKVKRSLR
ncbi:MAG: glycosyltransferase [Clostridia bacterium]|nr:glycosyltransferase [Clostridia bacterium]